MVCFADQNGDGQLGIDEFRVVYDSIGSGGMEAFLREAVASCADLLDNGQEDWNGDGPLAIVCAADLNG